MSGHPWPLSSSTPGKIRQIQPLLRPLCHTAKLSSCALPFLLSLQRLLRGFALIKTISLPASGQKSPQSRCEQPVLPCSAGEILDPVPPSALRRSLSTQGCRAEGFKPACNAITHPKPPLSIGLSILPESFAWRKYPYCRNKTQHLALWGFPSPLPLATAEPAHVFFLLF